MDLVLVRMYFCDILIEIRSRGNMKQLFITILIFLTSLNISSAQGQDTLINTATTLLNKSGKLNIAGYAEMHYNQPIRKDIRQNGKVDVHRLVMLFGYNFDKKVSFITEIEFEHVKEVFVEQAFVNYKIKPWLNVRGGLMLVPMGIVNEFHEPTTFFGVERTTLDNVIVPSTWRELGLGFSGTIIDASINYQAYLFNGFLSYDGSGKLKGSNGFRSGRQKGAEAVFTSPNFSSKINYYGIKGLNLGLALYAGNSQTTLYNDLDLKDQVALARADSSRVGMTMIGLDARYTLGGLKLRGQFNQATIRNSSQYNAFTNRDLGSKMSGYFVEAAYNLLRGSTADSKLYPFVRYSEIDTHAAVAGDLNKNLALDRKIITTGIDWVLANGVAFKADYQFFQNKASNESTNQFNLGIGVWFR